MKVFLKFFLLEGNSIVNYIKILLVLVFLFMYLLLNLWIKRKCINLYI